MDFTQASPGFPGLDEDGDRLGHAVAVGGFNNDGFDDLAAGAPSESINVNGDNSGSRARLPESAGANFPEPLPLVLLH